MDFLSSKNDANKEGIFFPAIRQQRLDLILHLIPNTQQAILLRGPEQSGKSFFIQQFLAQADTKWRFCLISAEQLMGSNTPLQVCAAAFDELEGNDKQLLIRLTSWSKTKEKVILCVEDAHQLDEARFNFIFKLSESYECIHIMLTSSDNLGEAVESHCQLIDIEPFTQKQTSDYARARINKNGLTLAGIDDVVLFLETGGLPGRINDVLDQMGRTPVKQSTAADKPKQFPLLWVSVAVMAVVVLAWGFLSTYEDNDRLDVEVEKKEQVVKKIATPKSVVERLDTQYIAGVELKPALLKEPVVIQKTSKKELAVSVLPLTAKAEPLKEVKKETGVMAKELLVVKPEIKEQPVIFKKEQGAPVLTKPTLLQKNQVWTKNRNKNHYTLQLLSVSTQASITEYVLKHKSISQLHFFQNKRNKGHWFTVIYGDYTNKAKALKAAKNLPRALGKLKPWARSFEAVHKDLYVSS